MLRGVTRHEVRARGTHLRAIQQQRDMGSSGMLAALLETVPDIVQARLMTSGAGVNARLHVIGVSRVCHGLSLR